VAVLPAYQRIVLDEAHNVEEVATNYFGITITRQTLNRLLARLISRERGNHGLLPFLQSALTMAAYQCPAPMIDPAIRLIQENLTPLRHSVAQALSDLMDLAAEGVAEALGEALRPKKELQLRITPSVEESIFWRQTLRRAIDHIADQLGELAKGMRQLHGHLAKLPEKLRKELDTPIGEVKASASKLEDRVNQFRNFYTIGENQCRWIEVYQSASSHQVFVKLISLPLEVQEALNQSIYHTTRTVVMTSATLTVDRRFGFFLNQVGLSKEHSQPDLLNRIATLQLDTPFDYNRQAFVGVPLDMPDPGVRQFTDSATEFLLQALQISQGSAFLLFTSYQQMNAFHDRLAPLLRSMGYSCLKQGSESRHVLLRRFKNDRTSILFATSSFWEGVDVPGDALTLLVLVKLPFRVPTDPLLQARVEMLDQMGVDSFSDYIVPQAVIKFKQGFGRLIRTREDFGAVLILAQGVEGVHLT
jgi:ATP-dependent DNA helicase DinG